MSYGSKRRWRVVLPLILVVMVFMRLVWMQLRTYPTFLEARALLSLELVGSLGGDESCRMISSLGPPSEADRAVSEARREASVAFASPGFAFLAAALCKWDRLDLHNLIQMNQAILAATVLIATLMTRFITSSWTVSLIVAAMLMSRGRLLTGIGTISIDHPIMLGVTIWLTVLAHYLRTGARLTLAIALMVTLGLAVFEPVSIALPTAAVVLLSCGHLFRKQLKGPLLVKLREMNKQMRHFVKESTIWSPEEPLSMFGRLNSMLRGMLGMELLDVEGPEARLPKSVESWEQAWEEQRLHFEGGSLLRTLQVPFTLWAYSRRRWLMIAVTWLFGGIIAGLLYAASVKLLLHFSGVARAPVTLQGGWDELREVYGLWQGAWWPTFSQAWHQRFDLHLAVSFIIVIFCAIQSPGAGLPSFFELTWLTIVGTLLLFSAAAAADFCDVLVLRQMLGHGTAGAPLAALGPRGVMAWIEPVWLTLGAAGVYNLMKVFDQD